MYDSIIPKLLGLVSRETLFEKSFGFTEADMCDPGIATPPAVFAGKKAATERIATTRTMRNTFYTLE